MVRGLATRDGLGFANATALIPLKAHAWLDLTRRRAAIASFFHLQPSI